MQGTQLLEHNYPLYIGVWFVATIFILWFFRFMYRKSRDTEDRQTKSSLFTITVIIGIPLLLATVIGPLVFIIGDKNMQPVFRYTWIGVIGIFLLFLIYKQRKPG
jgi:membrane-associated HD superfamily phosphohydrolase